MALEPTRFDHRLIAVSQSCQVNRRPGAAIREVNTPSFHIAIFRPEAVIHVRASYRPLLTTLQSFRKREN
jgi:hypothetical protein